MALLTIENVRRSYGSQLVLDDISFQVAQGECVALLGPSGCGKTTLLNIVAGFLEPDAGQIHFDGALINGVPPHRRNMGMVFQDYALFPHLNVIENLEFGLRMRGVPARDRRAPAMAALEMVGLGGMENRSVRQMSGGQQQRVAVARALVNEPRLLLFDEPLSNLDARLRDSMRSEIRALLDRTRISAIFVTHDQAEAFAIADRVALFNKGKLVQIGKAEDIYERPSSQFVASFLGGCNLLSGTIAEASEGGLIVSTSMGKLAAARSPDTGLTNGAEVSLAVRHHHLTLVAASGGTADIRNDGRNRVECEVEAVEYLGSVTRFTLKHAGGQVLMAQIGGVPNFKRGDKAVAGWDRCHTWPIFGGENA